MNQTHPTLVAFQAISLPPWLCASRALAAAPLLAWGQVNKVGDSRGSLRASLACVIQPRWVPRKMLAGQGNVYACAVV